MGWGAITFAKFCSATRRAFGDLLQHPTIAVGVAEGRERPIAAALWVGAGDPRRDPGMVEAPCGIVEDLAHLNSVFDQLGAGGVDRLSG